MFPRVLHWFSGLPITIVAAHSIFAGLVASACESAGWIDWGNEASILMVVPILGWAAIRWWIGLSDR